MQWTLDSMQLLKCMTKKIDVKFIICKLIYYYFILSFVVGNGVFVAAVVFVLIFFSHLSAVDTQCYVGSRCTTS